MAIINNLPSLSSNFTFTELYKSGNSNWGEDNYTTTDAYDYIIVVANNWNNVADTPNTTCSKGTQIYDQRENSTTQRFTVRVWKDVDSGAYIDMPRTGGTWSWQVIGVKA